MQLKPDARVGPYRVTGALGSGGMGVVYRAEDERLARPVAMKFLSGLALEDPRAGERLLREARAASALNHPHICTIYDVGEHEGAAYLVMELLEGQTLAARIAHGPLPEHEGVRLAAAVADALDAAHQRGIIHRDVKPANIFITQRGEPKLLDFGLARSFGHAAAIDATATNTATTAGTVAYMSPEQARDEPLDARSDLFSLGATLYQVVTGALPFPGSSTALVFDAILNKPPRRPSQINAAVSAPLEQILLRALEKDQQLRYQSAADLRADLQRLLRADSSSAVVAAAPPARPRWPLAVALAAVIAAGVLGSVLWRGTSESRSGPLTLDQVTESGDVMAAAISDDGKYVAYAEGLKDGFALHVRQIQTRATVTVIPPGTHQFRGVTFSPDGAYVYATTLKPSSLIRVPTLGGPSVKILDDVGTAVAVSPDGRQLAYLRGKGGDAELMVASADGSNPRAIGLEKRPPFGTPAWSPDGNSIAWPQNLPRQAAAISVTSVDGTRNERITIAGWQYVESVVWLPAGRGFVVAVEEPARELTGRHQILEITPSGSVVQRLTNDLSDYHALTGNPRIALAATPLDVRSSISIGALADTTQLGRVGSGSSDGVRGLTWSSDGQIVFTDAYSVGWVMKDDGSGHRPLLPERQSALGPAACGDAMSYGTVAPGTLPRTSVFLVDLKGGSPRHVLDVPFSDGDASCTPDGAWLLVADQETIKKVPTSGGEPVTVLKDGHFPRVSPDGRLLAAHRRAGGVDSYVIVSMTDGSLIHRLPGPVGRIYQWDVDGKALIETRGAGTIENLWRLPIDGSPASQVTQFMSDMIFGFAIAPDGRLAIARGEPAIDVVVLRP